MNEPRTRVRKPAPDVAVEEKIDISEPAPAPEPAEEAPAPKLKLNGPFTAKGFHIVDSQGRKIAMAGISGDVARTGNDIAEALVALLNR